MTNHGFYVVLSSTAFQTSKELKRKNPQLAKWASAAWPMLSLVLFFSGKRQSEPGQYQNKLPSALTKQGFGITDQKLANYYFIL